MAQGILERRRQRQGRRDVKAEAQRLRSLGRAGYGRVAIASALAAAVVGGGMFGSAAYAISSASNSEEQEDRERKAATGTLVLSVRAPSDAKRADAEAILRSSAATSVQTR